MSTSAEPERRRQVDALRLAARERRRQPIERQVVEPDVAEEAKPLANLAQNLVGNRRFFLRQRQFGEELVDIADREAAHGVDRPAADLDVTRLAPEPGAAALRTGQISTVAAEEHADVDLVFLPFEPPEEALDPFEAARRLLR